MAKWKVPAPSSPGTSGPWPATVITVEMTAKEEERNGGLGL